MNLNSNDKSNKPLDLEKLANLRKNLILSCKLAECRKPRSDFSKNSFGQQLSSLKESTNKISGSLMGSLSGPRDNQTIQPQTFCMVDSRCILELIQN